MTSVPAFASPVDLDVHGRYDPFRGLPDRSAPPAYVFDGRIGDDAHPAEPGRYHLYVALSCPVAQLARIARLLLGLEKVIGVSVVDDERDGRGWAFRERRGPDEVNGFTLLSQAYEATQPGYSGHISVPVLWDRHEGRILSNEYFHILRDLGTRFGEHATSEVQLYPPELAARIDAINTLVHEEISLALSATDKRHEDVRPQVIAALDQFEARLSTHRYLLGAAITEADLRFYTTLVRFDQGANALSVITGRPLPSWPRLLGYLQDLYALPAFRDTTLVVPEYLAAGQP
ncbi:glutathione S-transferase C-terminal domain-containing protein [Nonomuraea jabiensis]|uniref:Glutathione S-transferase/putative glutathione S-transferase n=1 Tax=Nonomuraea jabiensis TaxID=882448 RepID=A0A7W9GG87_9ACTN|nr:glutathione S-transferase C-terminal domain-containing protein [Nonomuraea jabiensis]MBB5783213.1 glutathione S-transferase/putative glutathione S-transferase [Nonomuraea jabiensis]